MTSSRKKNQKKYVFNDRTVDGPELLNVANSPVAQQKIEEAIKTLEKIGFPTREDLLALPKGHKSRSK